MTFQPNPAQSLLLWRMLTGETDEVREPMKSKVRPEMSTAKRNELVREGFLEVEKRGRAQHLLLTDRAWHWASESADVQFPRSTFAVDALQGLLRRLVPFLERNDLALSDVFTAQGPHAAHPAQAGSNEAASSLPAAKEAVLRAARELSEGRRVAVRFTALRAAVPHLDRQAVDAALVDLQDDDAVALFRDDDTPSLTAEDYAAALNLGGAPRHLLYVKD